MFKYSRVIVCLLVLALTAQNAWAARKLLGSSGPVDRPTVWAGLWIESDDFHDPLTFTALDSVVFVDFLGRGVKIDAVFLDGPGGLDGPVGPDDNRWYEIVQPSQPPLGPGYFVPNLNHAVLGPDEVYQNYPDSLSLGDWTGARWIAESAPDSMDALVDPSFFEAQVSYTGSVLIGGGSSGEEVSTLELRNLVPGAEYTLSFVSYFFGQSDYDWSCPPDPFGTFDFALENQDHYSLWVNIYSADETVTTAGETQQLATVDSGCPLPDRGDKSRMYFKDDWLILRGTPDETSPGVCTSQDLELWYRDGAALVYRGSISPPATALGQDFGASMAMDGNVLVVGSPQVSPADPAGGSAYLYEYDGAAWVFQTELKYGGDWGGNTSPGYASTVAYLNETLFIWSSDIQRLQMHGSPNESWFFHATTSSFFDLTGDTFGENMLIYFSDVDGIHLFLSSSRENACIDGVGAILECIPGGFSNNTIAHPFPNEGKSTRQWINDHFSQAMDVSLLRQAFGIPNNDEAGPGSGAVWVRHRLTEADPWVDSYLYPPRPVNDGEFGAAVAVEDNVLVIGSPGGISDQGPTGSCYLYRLDGDVWTLDTELLPTDVASGDKFGSTVSVDHGFAVVSSSGKNNDTGGLYLFSVAEGVSAVEETPTPGQLKISSVYPNPFNPSTLIRFAVPRAGPTSLRIHDLQGRLVKTLISESLSAGSHEFYWHGKNDKGEAVPSGVYFLRVVSGERTASQKITLLK